MRSFSRDLGVLTRNHLPLIAGLLVSALFLWTIYQGNSSQRAGCERNNPRAQANYDDGVDAAAFWLDYALQEHDPEKRILEREYSKTKQAYADSLIAVAVKSGFQLIDGSPQLDCNEAYPSPFSL